MPQTSRTLPPVGSVERWAWDLIHADTLAGKLRPGDPPEVCDAPEVAVRLDAPVRPPELRVVAKAGKQRGFASPHGRARLLHAFFHHELQAAELFAWALLAFPDAPREVRKGFARIIADEVRHASMYRDQVERLGFAIGSFPVRDWFWSRIPSCPDAASFCATMGLGFEAANLDHSARFEQLFATVGDAESSAVQAEVGRDEVAHVRFGVESFRTLRGALDFRAFSAALPAPLSPLVMRGDPIDHAARSAAGLDESFLRELAAWQPTSSS